LSQISDFDQLKRISEVSGGNFFAADDTASIPPLSSLTQTESLQHSELALFDYPLLLAVILTSLCVEWYLRKRYQLL